MGSFKERPDKVIWSVQGLLKGSEEEKRAAADFTALAMTSAMGGQAQN